MIKIIAIVECCITVCGMRCCGWLDAGCQCCKDAPKTAGVTKHPPRYHVHTLSLSPQPPPHFTLAPSYVSLCSAVSVAPLSVPPPPPPHRPPLPTPPSCLHPPAKAAPPLCHCMSPPPPLLTSCCSCRRRALSAAALSAKRCSAVGGLDP